ncbi:MAG: AlbA family DNA-binding domain-containing protein [Solirubrobacterales bacterium]
MAERKAGDLQRQLSELVQQPREDLGTEIKAWLDLSLNALRAELARELIALANHGGGFIVFGFVDDDDGWHPEGPCPFDLALYSQDNLNGICEHYAEPHFHCDVHRVRTSGGPEHVVVVVPGGHRVPIRSKRGGPEESGVGGRQTQLRADRYYIRRPGPQSAPISSGREWDDLLQRCIRAQREELVESFRSIVLGLGASGTAEIFATLGAAERTSAEEDLAAWDTSGRARLDELILQDLATETPDRFHDGTWSTAYRLVAPTEQPSPAEFLEILEAVAGHETGWPPWWVPTRDGIRPYPLDGMIECWLAEPKPDEVFRDGAHSDLWRADPDGRMFLVRGYQEDGGPDAPDRRGVLDVTLPVWRMGECLLHAQRLAERMGSEMIDFRVIWDGLEGRELVSLDWSRDIHPGRICHQDSVNTLIAVEAARVGDTLPELVKAIVEPLYSSFDFFSPPEDFYGAELAKMRSRTQ